MTPAGHEYYSYPYMLIFTSLNTAQMDDMQESYNWSTVKQSQKQS